MAERSNRFSRALKAPALHFVVVGLALFLAREERGSIAEEHSQAARAEIVIDARRLEELRREAASVRGDVPEAAIESYVIKKEIDDELLYREALRLGLDRTDRTVFWRLVEKMKFLGEAGETETDNDLFQRALAMGLGEKDPVIRRVLIRKLGMLIRFAARNEAATEAELLDYYERHPNLYSRPRRVTLAHVFFSADRRGDHVRADAERALATLREVRLQPARLDAKSTLRAGDPFLSGHVFTEQSRDGLAKLFGGEFADEVMRVPQGSWHGPIRSAFGFHLVEIRERASSGRLPPAAVRSQLIEGVEEEKREARLRTKLAELRRKYDVRIESMERKRNA